MKKALVFDVWGQYAHFKKIFATTSAPTYSLPPKTTLYGLVSAILGLEKHDNAYLTSFEEGRCQMGLEVRKPITMQRINTNLRPVLGRLKKDGNRKPTTIEYIYDPCYRIYFSHEDSHLYEQLKAQLSSHLSVYTPTLGLAYLIANFSFQGEAERSLKQSEEVVQIDSVIPKEALLSFDVPSTYENGNQIVEQNQYAFEMNTDREVTKRGDIIFDRSAKSIRAKVTHFEEVSFNNQQKHVIFF